MSNSNISAEVSSASKSSTRQETSYVKNGKVFFTDRTQFAEKCSLENLKFHDKVVDNWAFAEWSETNNGDKWGNKEASNHIGFIDANGKVALDITHSLDGRCYEVWCAELGVAYDPNDPNLAEKIAQSSFNPTACNSHFDEGYAVISGFESLQSHFEVVIDKEGNLIIDNYALGDLQGSFSALEDGTLRFTKYGSNVPSRIIDPKTGSVLREADGYDMLPEYYRTDDCVYDYSGNKLFDPKTLESNEVGNVKLISLSPDGDFTAVVMMYTPAGQRQEIYDFKANQWRRELDKDSPDMASGFTDGLADLYYYSSKDHGLYELVDKAGKTIFEGENAISHYDGDWWITKSPNGKEDALYNVKTHEYVSI